MHTHARCRQKPDLCACGGDCATACHTSGGVLPGEPVPSSGRGFPASPAPSTCPGLAGDLGGRPAMFSAGDFICQCVACQDLPRGVPRGSHENRGEGMAQYLAQNQA